VKLPAHAKPERNRRIREEAATGRTYQEIADQFGISRQRVDQIIKPRRHNVRRGTNRKIENGQIKRPRRCPVCETRGPVEAHHPDYTKPDYIEWRCVRCHKAEHRGDPRRQPAKQQPIPVTCPRCGTVRPRTPFWARQLKGYCSKRCAGRAARLHRDEVERRLRKVAGQLRLFVQQRRRVPTSGEFAPWAIGRDVGSGATALLVHRIDPGHKHLGSYSAVIDRIYLVAGFRRPDGRKEPHGYPLNIDEAAA
jgi:DNA-directed RNA polymerase subunit RPC12/RpoP